LAGELHVFSRFQETRVIADIVDREQLGGDGLLISTHGLSRPHTRVAFAMSQFRLNIISGKVNRVELGENEHGYCYFFQISPPESGVAPSPRELERIIENQTPPELPRTHLSRPTTSRGVRVEFSGNDNKGYRILKTRNIFERQSASLPHIRVILRDEPFLFFKVSRVFDLFGVEIQQSLITTTGNQVVDYFYLLPEDYERLRGSDFEESFLRLVNTPLQTAGD
ncbi:MAG: hypothetical protein OEW39_15955, partial [Deltaproteobacteria bacterium]|nr:hypothetical protein [Deltaproteobacteria bacterium]